MRRQAFVNWERVTKDNVPESGKEYLVAEVCAVDEKEVSIGLAIWHNKGDVVKLACKLQDITELSAEERLLQAIFGKEKEYVIPEAGFYEKTKDPNRVRCFADIEELADIEEVVVKLSDDIFFTEKPLVPEGYLSEEQAKKNLEITRKRNYEKHLEERTETVKTAMEANSNLNEVVTSVIGTKKVSANEMMNRKLSVPGIRIECETSTLEAAEFAGSAYNIVEGMHKILKSEGGEEKVKEILKEAQTTGHLAPTVKTMIDTNADITNIGAGIQYMIQYFEYLNAPTGYYFYRGKYLAKKKYTDIPTLVLAAYLMSKTMYRLYRCCRLRELNAPDIIMTNEIRMLTDHMIAHSHVRNLAVNEEDFAEMFGINMDGSEYEGLSWTGNFEKEMEEDESTEDCDGDCADCTDYDPEECACTEEPVDRYIIVDSPNFLCSEGFYSLWHPIQERYYREDGTNISVYKTWKDVRDVRERLNSQETVTA